MQTEIDDLFTEIIPPLTNGEDSSPIIVSAALTEIPELPVVADEEQLRSFIVRNPEAFRMKKVRDLFTQAFAEGGHLPNAIDAIEWCAGVCTRPTTGIIVAVEGDPEKRGKFRGLVIIDWNQEDPWAIGPWVLHWYSTGAPVVRDMADTLEEWLKSVGRTDFHGFNRTGASDEAYARFLSSHFDAEPQATLLELRMRE